MSPRGIPRGMSQIPYNQGMVTYVRRAIEPQISPTAVVKLPPVSTGLSVLSALVTADTRVLLRGECVFRDSFLDVRLKGEGMVAAENCSITGMFDGVGFDLRNCRIGSGRRPDGIYRRAMEDGIRPCRVPGSTATPLFTRLERCDIVNIDGRNGGTHMDGMQMWQDGNVEVIDTKIYGWWQSAVLLKSDHGPIDNVKFTGCAFGGANYFQLRIIDGGFGRPTNITISQCVVERGVKGGAHPINTGNDMCSIDSQTKFVRTEAERLDPAWIVYDNVCLPDGIELPPPGGWWAPSQAEMRAFAKRQRQQD